MIHILNRCQSKKCIGKNFSVANCKFKKSPFQLPVYSESYDSHNVSMPEETTQSTALVSKPTIDAQHQFDMHQSNVEQVNNVFVPHVERSITDIWKEAVAQKQKAYDQELHAQGLDIIKNHSQLNGLYYNNQRELKALYQKLDSIKDVKSSESYSYALRFFLHFY